MKGSRAVVTGAGSGLGRALTLELVARGAIVVAVGRRIDALRETVELGRHPSPVGRGAGGEALPFPCDVTNPDAASACREFLIAQLGGLDLLVCNAGVRVANDRAVSSPDVAWTHQVNFLSVVRWIEEMLPVLADAHPGRIVTVSSLGGEYGLPYSNGYNPSKAALTIFSQCLRSDLRAHRIDVNVTNVRPGFVETSMARSRFRPFSVSPERAARTILDATFSGRAQISFPWPMVLAATLLRCLPASLLARVGNRLVSAPPVSGEHETGSSP